MPHGELMQISKLLIANRGEIAVRIARACHAMGIRAVAVFSDADKTAMHVRACDEAYRIGPAPASESYLRADEIIMAAQRAGCQAVHPGYGFLSERESFARAVLEAGLIWIGPPPEAIALMGSKIEAKRLAEAHGVPLVPGYFGDDQSPAKLLSEAEKVGYPLLVKASAGGGGKGMRVVEAPDGLEEAIDGARREAQAAFGDSSLMLERYLSEPRHIEVQVLGDSHGNLIHLGERDCTVQRRHQKVIEESPSPAVDDEIRSRITASALALARAAGYTNAGTVEFIFQDGQYYFLEMNTRLQVEHPVTEEALGIDLVQLQIRIASGEELPIKQSDVRFVAHSFEARLYAEDPERGFLPSTGTITRMRAPLPALGARVDAGVDQGDSITPYYDPMIAKLIVSGSSRSEALARMRDALDSTEVEGVRTNLDFLRWLFAQPQIASGDFSTRFIERYYQSDNSDPSTLPVPAAPVEMLLASAAVFVIAPATLRQATTDTWPDPWHRAAWRQARQDMDVSLLFAGQRYHVTLSETSTGAGTENYAAVVTWGDTSIFSGEIAVKLPRPVPGADDTPQVMQLQIEGQPLQSLSYRAPPAGRDGVVLLYNRRVYLVQLAPPLSTDTLGTTVHKLDDDSLESPMPGKVLKLFVTDGDEVNDEQPLVIIEAMKMEFTVRAPHSGKVARVLCSEGDQVAVGDVLVEMEK
ncbi:MAG: ATP-grasp domain-containing protein [Chloroflexota bacterium]|nr:ATP-grasp domain-containing protein [Chloroflexota bacterium]